MSSGAVVQVGQRRACCGARRSRSTDASDRALASASASNSASVIAITLVTSWGRQGWLPRPELAQRHARWWPTGPPQAIGPGRLMGLYELLFRTPRVLWWPGAAERGDLASRRRIKNACRTLDRLLRWGGGLANQSTHHPTKPWPPMSCASADKRHHSRRW